MRHHRWIPVLFGFFLIILSLKAQDGFEEWLKQQDKQYEEYKQQQASEFAEFLERNWKDFSVSRTGPVYDEPKLRTTPILQDSLSGYTGKTQPPPGQIPQPPPDSPPAASEPDGQSAEVRPSEHRTLDFYGLNTGFLASAGEKVQFGGQPSKESIIDWWKRRESNGDGQTLKEIRAFRDRYGLNDWGMILALYRASEQDFGNERDAVLHTWYYLVRMGYDVRIAFSDNQLLLFGAVRQPLYNRPFFHTDGQRYYLLLPPDSVMPGRIQSYSGKFAGTGTSIDLRFIEPPVFPSNPANRTISFHYGPKSWKIPLEYDPNLVAFLDRTPGTGLEFYFGTHPSRPARKTLLEGLHPIVAGKDQRSAAAILLRFVQKGFGYKTDRDQFGGDRVLYPDETLHYGYCDCEDRVVLFTWLVRNLLNLEVVGVKYPGHMAAGVAFDEDVKGDAVFLNGRRYTICDPTYINAEPGKAIPQVRNIKPEVLFLPKP